MEFKGIMGGFYRLLEWVMRLSVINVLWIACAFPFFLFGLTILFSAGNNPDAVSPLLFLMLAATPIVLFPSTAAMFTVVRKWIMGESDAALFKTFFKGYKENYLKSLLGGLIFLVLGVIMYANFWFYIKQESNLKMVAYLFIPLSIILVGTLVHFFSLTVHYHMKLWQLLRNSVLVTISHPFTTISILVVNATILYLSFTWTTFLIPFFMGTFMAFFSFWSFYRIYHRMQIKQAQFEAKQDDKVEDNPDQIGESDESASEPENK